ncbi:DUF397 domain-containing protein [Streptomyces sp. NBC_01335]|uniref:DUF397 domain-containing protein n=1 Tax=Streptomyces sp. NBC_01335 TaxID=2903828 RepID=UPI002E133553|nr:DUF397 domain-containing protein [Streptomyces sp. NBC_01335]
MRTTQIKIADMEGITGWFKSTYSGGGGGASDCLEVASGHSTVPVRDSKAVNGPALVFSTAGWSSFVAAVKSGDFDA